MVELAQIRELVKTNASKIVLFVMDGLGGLPREEGGLTELESAKTPNLDDLARRGICGLHMPIAAGITPGSGPAHLALFGYDPLNYQIGRGVLSSLGINFDLSEKDVSARGNFCTIDDQGVVVDRRAGRISTEKCEELCERLRQIEIPGVEVLIKPVKEHRFVLVLHGDDLSGEIMDTDPHVTGQKPNEPETKDPSAEKTVGYIKKFIKQAREILIDQHPANMVLLRGFSKVPNWPKMKEVYGINGCAIAGYPMYRGVARLLGMDVLQTGSAFSEEIDTMEQHWNGYDFFFLHVKGTDSSGEDGDFDRKVHIIEEVDAQIPRIMDLKPDVLVVTGDHSTPALLKGHSWHPVPTLLYSKYCRTDNVESFGERFCMNGALGPRFPSIEILPLALANALRLDKYGA